MRTHEDYLTEGRKIAAAYLASEDIGGNPPDILVEKTAREAGLNAEQIRRLARATNVALFEAKYAAKGQESDRRVDFPVVKDAEVIERLQAKEPDGEVKTASAEDYPSFKNPHAPIEKVAEAVEPRAPTAREVFIERDALWRAARELPTELGAIQEKWASEIKALVPACRRNDHDHLAFEKNAVGLFGGAVVPELNRLRECLKLPALPGGTEKYAEAQEFLLGVATPATQRLKTAIALREEYAVKERLLGRVREARGEAR